MKKLKILGIAVVLLLLIVLVGTAQAWSKVLAPEEEWNRTFGGSGVDEGHSVAQTSDDGYIITGYTGNSDAWLIKTDSNGNEEWNKRIGGSYWDYGHSVAQTSDGGYIITGFTMSYGHGATRGDLWLIKTDSNGNEEWNKRFGGTDGRDCGHSVAQTSDGGYIITGYTESYGAGWADVWLIKTDSKGNEEWNKTFGRLGGDSGHSVAPTSDGGYIITGYTGSYGAGGTDAWLIKTDANGNEQWNRTFGREGDEMALSIQQTSDGGYILTGLTNSYGAGEQDVLLIKTDANGKEQWDKTFGGAKVDQGYSVAQTSDGGYIIAGMTLSYGVGDNGGLLLIKTDSKGNEIWNKIFDGIWLDSSGGPSVAQTSDGGYITVGSGGSYEHRDVYLIKLEPDTATPPPEEKTTPNVPTEKETTPEIPTGEEKGIPGFEAAFAVVGLLAVAYILRRSRK